ncbi:MAG: hypothetical protein JKY03_07730 [Aureispira sp.]|nr:hypothetical protein [Aureispira sp.]
MTEEEIVQDVLSNLKIENPCPMLLGRLKGEESGNYYCNSCEKTIVDFRDLSDQEVFAKLQEGTSCGIFYEDQLKGQRQVRRYNWMKKAAFYALMTFSWVGFNVAPLQAQVNISKSEKEKRYAMPKEASDKGVEPMHTVKTISKGKTKEEPVVKKEKKKTKRRRYRRRRSMGCPVF